MNSVEDKFWFAILTLATIGSLWAVTYLPMVDLPQHAAQVAIARGWGDQSLGYSQLFEVNWFTPYLLGYGFTWFLSLFLPVAAAVKLVVTLAVLGVPFATRRLLRVAGADPRWALATFPAAFSFAFYWGFLNFLVAIPLGLVFLAEVLRYRAAPTRRMGVRVAALGLLLFFAHILVMAVCSGLGLLILLSSLKKLRGIGILLPVLAPWPVAAAWLYLTPWSPGSGALDPIWNLGAFRIIEAFTLSLGRSGGLFTTGVVGVLLSVPFLTGARPSRLLMRWLPLANVFALVLLGPFEFAGTAFIYQRFSVFILPFYYLAFDAPTSRPTRLTAALLPAVSLIWIALTGGMNVRFSTAAQGFDEVLELVPRGAKVLFADLEHLNGAGAQVPAFMHFGAWYQVRTGGVVDYSFAQLFPQPFRYLPDVRATFPEIFPWEPDRFDWEIHRGRTYDYFLFRSRRAPPPRWFRGAETLPTLVLSSGWWWLYQQGDEQAAVLPSLKGTAVKANPIRGGS